MVKKACSVKAENYVKNRAGKAIADVKLEEVKALRVKLEDGTQMNFMLKETFNEELKSYRDKGASGFVLKKAGKLYYTSIPKTLNLVTAELLGSHMCANKKADCKRLSALSDEEGGCAKVRNRSCCIECYDWITEGYETFGTKKDVFVVINCSHFERTLPRKTISDIERKEFISTLKVLFELYQEGEARCQSGNTYFNKIKKYELELK